jgi:hypothetical protein
MFSEWMKRPENQKLPIRKTARSAICAGSIVLWMQSPLHRQNVPGPWLDGDEFFYPTNLTQTKYYIERLKKTPCGCSCTNGSETEYRYEIYRCACSLIFGYGKHFPNIYGAGTLIYRDRGDVK